MVFLFQLPPNLSASVDIAALWRLERCCEHWRYSSFSSPSRIHLAQSSLLLPGSPWNTSQPASPSAQIVYCILPSPLRAFQDISPHKCVMKHLMASNWMYNWNSNCMHTNCMYLNHKHSYYTLPASCWLLLTHSSHIGPWQRQMTMLTPASAPGRALEWQELGTVRKMLQPNHWGCSSGMTWIFPHLKEAAIINLHIDPKRKRIGQT